MLKLVNVSKFYYNKGIVSSGFSKINLEFNLGEFVAITGESGSGKSTLLNVISGLDSYEEGEMYVNGEDTSAYTEKDFEEYRRKYIANIFQSFNLVNSYSVYQNIELILLINGYKSKEVKEKVLDVIDKVGLTKYKNTKASKLSGGQKQRVAIARALVKDTPIIVTDEPTGNLDVKSANNVMRLLNKIAKEKLVIVVTHNYEQVEPYATRKIKMHDGKVVEDKRLKEEIEADGEAKISEFKKMPFVNKLKLGFRNTFNVFTKFVLLLLIFSFLTLAVTSFYSSFRQQAYEQSKIGYNAYFKDTNDKRIIIKKDDLTAFTEEDYEKISKITNVDKVVRDDLLIDKYISLYSEDLYFAGEAQSIDNFDLKLSEGRMPEAIDEVIAVGNEEDFYFKQNATDLLEKEMEVSNNDDGSSLLDYKVKIVGIAYNQNSTSMTSNYLKYYTSNEVLDVIRRSMNTKVSTIQTNLNNNLLKQDETGGNSNKIVPSNQVSSGYAIVPSEFNMYGKDGKCINFPMTVTSTNIYFSKSINVTISAVYDKDNFKKVTSLDDYDYNNGIILVNTEDYYQLFNNGNYQSSVYVKDVKGIDLVKTDLTGMGINALCVKDTLVNYAEEIFVIYNAFKVVMSAILLVGLFFIAYFIIKLVLKSRNVYFSTIRILGATKNVSNQLLNIELFSVLNISFLLLIALVILVSNGILNIKYIYDLVQYLNIFDYVVLYVVLVFMSLLISLRYAKQLFNKSAMNVYKEEV